jgi:hypothetical protein
VDEDRQRARRFGTVVPGARGEQRQPSVPSY